MGNIVSAATASTMESRGTADDSSSPAGKTSSTAAPAANQPEEFTLYIPPIGIPIKIKLSTPSSLPIPIKFRKDLSSTITKHVSDIASKTKKRSDRYPTQNDWMLIDITNGKKELNAIPKGPDVQQDIVPGAKYLVLSTQGVSELPRGAFSDGEGQDGSEERVRKWISDMSSNDGNFITPGSSEDGTFIGLEHERLGTR
ncbi:hypothetical protein BDD12DRAFT_843737 [Trichophaea hybrida]|nr:hypothetical protein BDD12DRAFT_843737 [Trichophaea hybrida]